MASMRETLMTLKSLASRGKTRADAGNSHARYGDGVYLSTHLSGADFAQLTDVADGRVRALGAPEAGVGCNLAHYVSSTEILFECTVTGTAPVMRVLYRVDPRVLPYVR